MMNPRHLASAINLQKTLRHLLTIALCVGSLTLSVHADDSVFEAWRQKYDVTSTVSQGGTSVAIDSHGNVAVTGFAIDSGDDDKRYYTARYAGTTGELIWEKFFDGGIGENLALAVAVDSVGNVIVTGGVVQSPAAGQENFYTIKYAAADGAVLWERTFDSGNLGADQARFIAVDSADNVIVAGSSVGTAGNEDIQLLRYSPGGTMNGQFRFTGAQTRPDFPTGLVIDSGNFAIVSGTTQNTNGDTDIYLAKVDLGTQAAVWTRITNSMQGGSDDEANGVAVDPSDNVFVAGYIRAADNTHQFHTRKYNSAGTLQWQQTFTGPEGDFLRGAIGVVADAEGNAYVTGSSTVDNFTTTIYTAKYASANGAVLWEKRSPAPDDNDRATGIAIDPGGNPIVTGASDAKDESGADYYTVKYSAASGAVIWEQHFNGNLPGGGDDLIADIATDAIGDVAITGTSFRPHPNQATGLTGFVTIKYGQLLGLQGDDVPDEGVPGSGVPNKSVFTSIGAAAIADNGTVASRISAKAGLKRFTGILVQGAGDASVPAVQGKAAPDIADGKFKSFSDPLIAPNGTVAFVAKLSGVPDTKDTAVFTDAINGDMHMALQEGVPVPGLAGELVRTISSVSLRNGQLVALLKLKGTGVTDANSTVLLGMNAGGGTQLLRTGPVPGLAVGGQPASAITKITVLSPPRGSAGHGRWQGTGRVVARVVLEDGRVVVVSVTTAGAVSPLLFTDQDAAGLATLENPNPKWKSFGFPGVATNGFNFVALGALKQEGDITKSNDTALVYSFNGAAFAPFAVEDATAVDAGGAKYAGFFDPVVNPNGDVAFFAGLKGTGVKASNNLGLWFGNPAAPELVARLGHRAPDGDGIERKAKWVGFSSVALPGGTAAGPIFLARVDGPGVTNKNNFGLWGVDSTGLIRQLVRTGERLGTRKIAAISLLKPAGTAAGATRSFNSKGGVQVLVTFTNATKAVIVVGVP